MSLTMNEEVKIDSVVAYQNAWRDSLKNKVCSRTDFESNLQCIFTQWELCHEIIDKLERYTNLFDKTFLTFNLEFVEVLLYNFGVKKENITYITDCKEKVKIAHHPRLDGIKVYRGNYLLWNNMKFDVIVGNPPYQKPTNGGNGNRDLWPDFVKKSLELLKENGYLCLIHPARWRKPEHELWPIMTSKQVHFLEIHSKQDGINTFGVTTRYDWYILQNTLYTKPSVVKDEKGNIHTLDLRNYMFFPNYMLDEINNIISKNDEEKCEIIYSSSIYETRREWMNEKETKKFKYPCVYAMYKDESIKYWYSSVNDKGHFGESKVICTCAEWPYAKNDFDGIYGMAQNVFGIKISSKEEGDNIVKALNSDKFKEIIKATKWNNFQIDWRMFKYFRKDFWKEFVNN